MSRRILLPVVEVLVGFCAGLLCQVFGLSDLAMLIWAVSGFQTLSRWAFQATMSEGLEPVAKLAQIMDLHGRTDVESLANLQRLYFQITEAEFRALKDSIVAEASERLLRLATEKASDELPAGEYYSWLLPMLDKAPTGGHIWAVSMMLDSEWDGSAAEEKFLRANIDASERGVRVERVFVVPRASVTTIHGHPAVQAHWNEEGNFEPYFVEQESLKARDPELLDALGSGFIAFDDRVALVDGEEGGQIRGKVTMNRQEMAKLGRMFANLKNHATQELPCVVAASATTSD